MTTADPTRPEENPTPDPAADRAANDGDDVRSAPSSTSGQLARPTFAQATTSKLAPFLNWLDKHLERLGDRFNPIMVKEARQSLKSRQFVATFFILLACAWGWSVLGVLIATINTPDESPPGWVMLNGYFLVLVIPVLLVVPFSAFRSLAAEREDGTFELVSITTLSANQIVLGKLCSAMLQLLLCFSVLAPCMVFTYVLRGVDLAVIGCTLAYTFLCSMLFIVVGLMIGATSKSRHWNTFFSVCLILAFCSGGFGFCGFILGLVIDPASGFPTDSREFWTANLCMLSIVTAYLVLGIMAAGSQVSFASDNRSTRLRICMVALQFLFVGWGVYFFIHFREPEAMYLTVVMSCLHWAVMGLFMNGETGRISARARRKLPQTAVGRALLTWFNPGSGTGYALLVSNLTVVIAMVFIVGEVAYQELQSTPVMRRVRLEHVQWTTCISCMYVILYVGLTRIILCSLRLVGRIGLFLTLMMGVVVASLGAGAPFLLQQWLEQRTNIRYSATQALNWAWTIGEASEGDVSPSSFSVVIAIIAVCTGLTVLINLALTVKEVMLVAQATPRRVVEDDQAIRDARQNKSEST